MRPVLTLLMLTSTIALAACSEGGRGTPSSTAVAPIRSSSVAGITSLVVAGAPAVSGDVSLVYRITDPSSMPTDVTVTYSTDGGQTWSPTRTGAGGSGLVALRTGPGLGVEHVFVWDSAADIPGYELDVRVRVAALGGQALASGPLAVDNMPLSTRIQLTRRPYLQSTTQTSVLVAWNTDVPTDSLIEFGSTTALGQQAGDPQASTRFHDVLITGLQPGQGYTYRVVSGGVPVTTRLPFETAPLPTAPEISFLAFGDSGTASPEQYALAARMATEDVDFVITTGDMVYPRGGFPHAEAEYDLRFFLPYQDMLERRPIFPSAGNHDAGSLFIPFTGAFFLPDNGGPRLTQELYYSFEWGDAKFIVLETTALFRVPVGRHMSWLLDELRNNQRKWLIVYCHHPLYGAAGGTSGLRPFLGPLFELGGVDLVVAGHDHSYERTVPIADFNRLPSYRGITHIITGGGGAGLDNTAPNAQSAQLVNAYHYVKFTIRGDQLFGEAIDLNGQTIDSFTVQNQ